MNLLVFNKINASLNIFCEGLYVALLLSAFHRAVNCFVNNTNIYTRPMASVGQSVYKCPVQNASSLGVVIQLHTPE